MPVGVDFEAFRDGLQAILASNKDVVSVEKRGSFGEMLRVVLKSGASFDVAIHENEGLKIKG